MRFPASVISDRKRDEGRWNGPPVGKLRPRSSPLLAGELESEHTYGMSELMLSGFLRVVTHPQIFREPTPVPIALAFVEAVRDRHNCAVVRPGKLRPLPGPALAVPARPGEPYCQSPYNWNPAQ